jgi:hypothetical protein
LKVTRMSTPIVAASGAGDCKAYHGVRIDLRPTN